MHPVRSIRRPPAALWALLFIGLLSPSLIWIAEDRSVWGWDQAWYGEVSTDLSFFMVRSFRHWVGELADGMSLKPPGIAWLGQLFVPLHQICGSVEISLLVSILATQCALLVILFRIGRRLCPHSSLGAVAGVAMAAGGSLFVGLSHQYFVEPLQAAAVAWVYYVAIEAPRWPRPRVAVQLALAIVVGVLAKADTPLYCVLPCLYAAGLICRKMPSRAEVAVCWKSRIFRIESCLLGIVGLAAALWYGRNLGAVWQCVRDASFGAAALDYGRRDAWLHKLVEWWKLLYDAFLAPYIGWAFLAVLAGAGLLAMRSFGKRRAHARIEPIVIAAALQTVLLLSVLSASIVLEPRYLYAMLPALAILFMWLCAFIPARAVAAVVIVCLAQWAVENAESLAIVGRLSHTSQWLVTPELDRARLDDLGRVVRLTSDAEGRYDIVAVESRWVNANAASFLAATNRLHTGVRSRYTSVGYAESDLAAAMRRIGKFRARYVITLAEPFQTGLPGFLNVVSLPVLREMRSDSRFTQVPYASRNGILVFRVQDATPGRAF